MPLEIRELHIRVTVNQPHQGADKTASAVAGDSSKTAEEKEAIISQCVEEVLQIINNKKER